jgi:hypothetical protein
MKQTTKEEFLTAFRGMPYDLFTKQRAYINKINKLDRQLATYEQNMVEAYRIVHPERNTVSRLETIK